MWSRWQRRPLTLYNERSFPAPMARPKAILTVSALLGAVELARAVSDQTLSHEILEDDFLLLGFAEKKEENPMEWQ